MTPAERITRLRELDYQGLDSWARATLESLDEPQPHHEPGWYRHAAIKLAEKSLPMSNALPALLAVAEAALGYRHARDCVRITHAGEVGWTERQLAGEKLDAALARLGDSDA